MTFTKCQNRIKVNNIVLRYLKQKAVHLVILSVAKNLTKKPLIKIGFFTFVQNDSFTYARFLKIFMHKYVHFMQFEKRYAIID